ncbi:unnamed protein product [Spirodela intermedia]|uniref:Uncharacterized protein n=1 Tax=Spirodela intermedia TaxID=51605 RepID=A0A7I8IY73_SPIIN|nr:unnamed protein product [Spirodela intermedia]CAA6662103.1 unnamed protein product [Spirodela intermedia]
MGDGGPEASSSLGIAGRLPPPFLLLLSHLLLHNSPPNPSYIEEQGGKVNAVCAKMYTLLISCLLLSLMLQARVSAEKKSYVVYLGRHFHGPDASPEDYERARSNHHSLLGLSWEKNAGESIIYSYTNSINGFAANLDEEQAREIADDKILGVYGPREDGVIPPSSIWAKARFGEDVIIGSLDSGVWPESVSFRDEGIGPVPARWQGSCEGQDVPCNSRFGSARDFDGHGTHTLSTAAGRLVAGANLFGLANGTAKGGSPAARVAAYKVCGLTGCSDADMLAGFDAAIHDGVDVISVSIGSTAPDFFANSVAIGSFHAVERGIAVVCAAGNIGPEPYSVRNSAPWILTVAAGSDGRAFTSRVYLGNGEHVEGLSLASGRLPPKDFYPIIASTDAKVSSASTEQAQLCYLGSLEPEKVKGKIVVCLRGDDDKMGKVHAVSEAGGIGAILVNDASSGRYLTAVPYMIPAVHVSYDSGTVIFSYLNSTQSPVGRIGAPTSHYHLKEAPYVASFSSRGPTFVSPQILKPDILAPGVDILAAYSLGVAPTFAEADTRRVAFNIISGTSMACPHVSGVVGLLKMLHPQWSPAAVKSAIMTTGPVHRKSRHSAGLRIRHIHPNQAMDPGLVYDLGAPDYFNFLCAIGYNPDEIPVYAVGNSSCPAVPMKLEDLNYPSITVHNLTNPITITRTVKNVGKPGAYQALVRPPPGVSVSVEPKILMFSRIGEEKTFQVTMEKQGEDLGPSVFGQLTWSDGKHRVRSPLSVVNVPGEFEPVFTLPYSPLGIKLRA